MCRANPYFLESRHRPLQDPTNKCGVRTEWVVVNNLVVLSVVVVVVKDREDLMVPERTQELLVKGRANERHDPTRAVIVPDFLRTAVFNRSSCTRTGTE